MAGAATENSTSGGRAGSSRRAELLAELTGAARTAAAGTGSLILLAGEAGIGKTSLARALATAVRSELTVTWGSCSPDGSAPPFWPWRALLPVEAFTETHSPAVEVDRAIGANRLRLLAAMRDQLIDVTRYGPRLHIMEDLQWADVGSVLLLHQLGTSVSDLPLLILGSLRIGEPLPPQLADALEDVRRTAPVHEIPHLDDAEIALLMGEAGIVADPELATTLLVRTGGNPLFVAELLRSVRVEHAADLRAAFERGVPGQVSELLGRRLARLPEPVSRALEAAAVMGSAGETRILAEVLNVPLDALIDLLDQGRAARVLNSASAGRWQFRHDLVRDAVYEGLSDLTRIRLHRATLEVLLATSRRTPPPVLAHHALAAQPLFDAAGCLELASHAGEAAFAHHAYEEALSWFSRALEIAPPALASAQRAELLVRCGEAHRHIGEIEPARRAFAEAADLTDTPDILARAALGYADPGADLGIAYRAEDALTARLLQRAIQTQPPGDSTPRVLLETRLAAELYFSDPGKARDLARGAAAAAERIGDAGARVAAGAVMHDAFAVGQTEAELRQASSAQLFEWAQTSQSRAARLTALRARVFDLLAAGDLAGMDSAILAFRRIAEPLRVPGYLWWPALWSAMRALLDGRHDIAEARGHEASDLGARSFPVLSIVNFSFLLFFLRREQGRLAEMEHATREYADSHPDVPAIRVALALLLAETGRSDETRGMLVSLSPELARLRDRNWPASWFQLARASFLVGDVDLARRLLDPAIRPGDPCISVSLATVCLGSSDLATAWLHHAVGNLDEADLHYRLAAQVNARLGARSWLAQTQADHAGLHFQRGRPEDRATAADLVRVAADAADAIGLRLLDPLLVELRAQLDASDTPDSPGVDAGATFRRIGAVWQLSFAGRTVQLPHGRGLQDIATLLARPGEAVSVLTLTGDGDASTTIRGAEAFDERARREIRDRLRDLDAEVDQAEADHDGERAAWAREARQQLAETVARDLGLRGRSRRVGDPVERARKTASTRIRRAIASIGRHHPELGRHLERSIDTGTWCAYRPPEPIVWST